MLIIDLLMERGYPVMLVGGAGSGKLNKCKEKKTILTIFYQN